MRSVSGIGSKSADIFPKELIPLIRVIVTTSDFNKFRNAYPDFIFDPYRIDESDDTITIDYFFKIPGLSTFSPRWIFPKPKRNDAPIAADATFRSLVFSLGLVELVSYWKITCSPRVIIKAGFLNTDQIDWWKKLYFNGLGEFFYKNGIDTQPFDFMHIETTGESVPVPERKGSSPPNGYLVPIGGGKDSIVTLDLLQPQKEPCYCYAVNPTAAAQDVIKASGCDDEHCINVARTLDPNMLELNRQGFLNGHTPFSAIVAFSSVMAAHIYGIRYVVLSNESSANESTIPGSKVNHQYSKSFEFENDFHGYEKSFIKSGVYYFSLLRPLTELQISEHFSRLADYHHLFRSCNVGSKQNIWCCHCPKCLFVFLILSPFMSRNNLIGIFGDDLLNNENLKETFDQLIGILEEKPFECVGSRDEINVAICMSIRNSDIAGEPLPLLLDYYRSTELYDRFKDDSLRFAGFFDRTNLLTPEFEKLISSEFFPKNTRDEVQPC